MKKYLCILLVLLSLLFSGCKIDDPKYMHFEKKPSINYYTAQICSLLTKKIDYKLEIYDSNLCRSKTLDGEDKKFLIYFLNESKQENYLNKDDEILSSLDREPYEFKINFETGEKFIIKIYSPSIVSISPWDGIFEEDYLNTESFSAKYNPYEFCKSIEKISRNNYTN